MLNIENEVTAAEIAEMNAEIDSMKTLDMDTHEMANKLNLIAAGLILLGNAEYGIAWGAKYSDPSDPGVDSNIRVALDEYNANIKPFAVALHELRIGGVVEHVTLDNLLNILDSVVVTVEEYEENGIASYDKKAGDIIKKALRNRKRRNRR